MPNEEILLADVPNLMPRRGGKKIHKATVYRWAKVGNSGVKLRTKWCPVNGLTTTRRDLDLFLKQVANARGRKKIAKMVDTAAALKDGGWE